METNMALLERCNDEWKALLKEFKGDSKANQSRRKYLWAAKGDDDIMGLLLDSKEMTACFVHTEIKFGHWRRQKDNLGK